MGDNRVLFMLKDGSKAWEIKDFLVTQDRCEVVTIEGKDYYGKGHPSYEDPEKVFNLLFLIKYISKADRPAIELIL